MGAARFDFAVVGGGAAGLMSAYELLQTGASVAVADAGYPRASAAGAGIISALPPWKYPPRLAEMISEGGRRFGVLVHEIETEGGGRRCEWRRPGMLVLPDGAVALPGGAVRVPARWLAPLLAPPLRGVPGVWMPEVGQLRAARFAEGLAKLVKKRGARFWRGAAAFHVSANKISKLSLAGGDELSAGAYVLCAGARSGALCPPPKPPVAPVRGELLLYRTPKPLMCVVLAERENFYLAPVEEQFLVAGASYEDAGFDDRPAAAVQAALHKRAAALFPPLAQMRPVNSWSGLRPAAPENMPVIGAHPRYENLYLNTGHGRYGISLAPSSARHLLKVVGDKTAPNPFAFREEWAA